MAEYTAPAIEKIADYSEATRGGWRGRWNDYYGGRYGLRIVPV